MIEKITWSMGSNYKIKLDPQLINKNIVLHEFMPMDVYRIELKFYFMLQWRIMGCCLLLMTPVNDNCSA